MLHAHARAVWLLPLVRRSHAVLGLGLVLLLLSACGSNSTARTPPGYISTLIGNSTPTPTAMAGGQTSPAGAHVIYVALGASDAVGVGAGDPATQGYVPLLTQRLQQVSPTQTFNLGISGITLHPALSQELPLAFSDHPTLVTIWLAANDFRTCVPLQSYAADLDTLLGQLQNQTQAHIFVANLPDLTLLPAFQNGAPGAGACVRRVTADEVRSLIVQWNGAIRAAAAAHGAILVDLYTSDLVSHPEYVSSDGFHPSSAGYARLADLFWSQLLAHGGVAA
jgi:acyl-CoA thioesterase I